MKLIQTPQDLAINGTVLAFEQALYVERPNIGNREGFLNYIREISDFRWPTNNGINGAGV